MKDSVIYHTGNMYGLKKGIFENYWSFRARIIDAIHNDVYELVTIADYQKLMNKFGIKNYRIESGIGYICISIKKPLFCRKKTWDKKIRDCKELNEKLSDLFTIETIWKEL